MQWAVSRGATEQPEDLGGLCNVINKLAPVDVCGTLYRFKYPQTMYESLCVRLTPCGQFPDPGAVHLESNTKQSNKNMPGDSKPSELDIKRVVNRKGKYGVSIPGRWCQRASTAGAQAREELCCSRGQGLTRCSGKATVAPKKVEGGG